MSRKEKTIIDAELPVKLITYEGGAMDLHRQTGQGFDEAIAQADKKLKDMGLVRVEDVSFIGPTGAYMSVEKADL